MLGHVPLSCECLELAQRVRAFQQAYSCFSGGPRVSPVLSLLCYFSPLRVSSQQLAPVLSLRTGPQSLSPRTQASLTAGEPLLSWKLLFGLISVVNFLFCLVVLPSEDPKFPPYLTCDRVSYCVETSPPSGLPPWDRRTHREILCFHFCLYLFCTYSEEINLPFWMSGSSDSVQWELFHTHMIF